MTLGSQARSLAGNVVVYASLVLAATVALLPLIVVFMAGFKTRAEFREGGPLGVPVDWFHLDNFITAFTRGGMAMGLLNTTFILVVSVTGSILIGSMAAFAISRFDFRGRRLVVFLFLFATLVPAVTAQVATFQLVVGMGLFNTRWAAIALFTSTDIIGIYIFLQFLRGVPRSLDEAAYLDGASSFRVYRSIVLPLLKPAIATVVIIKGVAIYNEFYIPFLYMPSRDLGVVATSLFRFQGPYSADWQVISAGVVITIIPTLIVFLALQRYIYNGFTRGTGK
ncbi:MAG: carbohydrate ABC transporter permease [Chloroflexi bacterium]|nr:carbohydrate ABC transporter permease [Chloroflexota bacterium]